MQAPPGSAGNRRHDLEPISRLQPRCEMETPGMEKRRERMLGFVTVVITVVLCLLAAEIVLRFLPVASGTQPVAVNAQSPVFHFTPNRDIVYSLDWDLVLANRRHINNAGFVNDQDYRKDDPLPLLAVIGDSYIEAPMVPYGDTLPGRLAKAYEGRARVYSFAASGAPLSQYLIWARHAVREYGAQVIVINVVGNDFDESHASYTRARPGLSGYWHYAPDERGELKLRLFDFRPRPWAKIVHSSALANYMIFHLRLNHYWHRLLDSVFGTPALAEARYAGNTWWDPSPERMRDSQAVIDAFFRDLPDLAALPKSHVLFVVDGFRYPHSVKAGAGSYWDLIRKAFIEKGRALGYEMIDLDRYFLERNKRTGEQFEFARDAHWSAIGHGVAFDAVMASQAAGRFPQLSAAPALAQ
jgi:hypothetical protein